jgi:hypothetical protein
MAVQEYGLYNTSTGLIENIVTWDAQASPDVTWPDGYAVVLFPVPPTQGTWSVLGIGWSYIDNQFVEPPNPNPPE